jgi:hypothetical protein
MKEAPPPAEASTEVGQEEPDFYSPKYVLEEIVKMLVGSLVIAAVILLVAFAAGYFI